MSFFPADPKNYRPAKVIFRVDVLREADRAVQEGLGGYENRHELINDLVEQGLIGLRYPDGEQPMAPTALSEGEARMAPGQNGAASTRRQAGESAREMPAVLPFSPDASAARIEAPDEPGVAIKNHLAKVPNEPMFGMHNRDAPSAWALGRLATEAADGPVPLSSFYEKVTEEAWTLAARLSPLNESGKPKLAVMLPRNPEKPQAADEGFRAFALGQVARKPDDDGKLAAWGPFYQWGAVGIVGDPRKPEIGLTEAGWELLNELDGLDFSLPHGEEIAERFLGYLERHARSDLWGFQMALDGAADGLGRVEMADFFAERLTADFSAVEWKGSVAESVASGYISRARAWGLVEPKLKDRKYPLTAAGSKMLERFASATAA
jgi:hypothetical protein